MAHCCDWNNRERKKDKYSLSLLVSLGWPLYFYFPAGFGGYHGAMRLKMEIIPTLPRSRQMHNMMGEIGD